MPRLEFQFRKLEQWPRPETSRDERKRRPFKTDLPKTLRLLAYELHRVGAINPVLISTWHSDREIRIDGLPRADVRPPKFSGVALEFMARPGRLQFATDICTTWTDNLHAIALTMEWLRGVERYGAAGGDKQYAGFKALPPPGAAMNVEDAAELIANEGGPVPMASVLTNVDHYRAAYRRAALKLHPDRADDGQPHDPAKWARLQHAQAILDAHHKAAGPGR